MKFRPRHLIRRTFTSKWFAEDVLWIRRRSERNFKGVNVERKIEERHIRCSTTPPYIPGVESLKRRETESGARITEGRMFYHIEDVNPIEGDVFVYNNSRYRVKETTPWGDFSSTFCERMEEKDDLPKP